MADTVVAASLTLNADQANQSVKSFKSQLKDANTELLNMQKQFGETSKEALIAAQKVAALKESIKDAKEVTALFDPGAKFQAFGNVVRTVAGGMTALTGTMALFGGESKDVEKALLKVQAALAITEGINTIVDAAKDFQRLNALIQQSAVFQKANAIATNLASLAMRAFGITVETTTVGFKALKLAIAATGIGLLVVGLTFLINKIIEWTSATDTAEEAQKKLSAAIDSVNDSLESNLNKIDFNTKKQIALAKQAGASEQELQDIKQKGLQQELTQLTVAANLKSSLFNQALKQNKIEKDKLEETRKDAVEAEKVRIAKNQQLQLSALDFDASVAEKKREKEKQDAAKALEKSKADAEKRLEAEKAATEQLEELKSANFLASIAEGRKRDVAAADIEFDTEARKVEALKISEEKKTELIEQLNIQRGNKIADINNKIAIEQGAKEKEALANLQKVREENQLASIADENERARKKADIDLANTETELKTLQASEDTKTALLTEAKILRQKTLADIDAKIKEQQDELKIELDEQEGNDLAAKLAQLDNWYKEKQKIAVGNEQLLLELQKSYEDQRTALEQTAANQRLANVAGTLGKAAELFGKQTAAGKVLAIAEATINTYAGATLALREKSTLPQPFSTIQKIVSVGLIIATGLKSIREIAKTKVPGGSGGGASTPAFSVSAAAPLAPQPQVTTTQLDQQTLNNTNNATVRAYVNEADISNSQERITRLNRAARLGG